MFIFLFSVCLLTIGESKTEARRGRTATSPTETRHAEEDARTAETGSYILCTRSYVWLLHRYCLCIGVYITGIVQSRIFDEFTQFSAYGMGKSFVTTTYYIRIYYIHVCMYTCIASFSHLLIHYPAKINDFTSATSWLLGVAIVSLKF